MKKLFILLFLFVLSCSNNINNQSHSSNEEGLLSDNEVSDSSSDEEDPKSEDSSESDKQDSSESEKKDSSDDEVDSEPITMGAHFAEVGRVDYTLNGSKMKSGAVRLYYTFQPADKSPETAPLFVFFNGGPGYSTTMLFTFNTSKMTADPDFAGGEGVVENPYSFTKIGNIIHVDQRMTGFSYGFGDWECTSNSFNHFHDAADFIRVILDVFKRFPKLAKNPVYLVGESYGGVRATIMMNMLLFYQNYLDGTEIYRDPDLFNSLESHFRKIFPDINGDIGPEIVAKQFAGQVLIQPLIAGDVQRSSSGKMLNEAGSPLFGLGEETGTPFEAVTDGDEMQSHALGYVRDVGRDFYAIHKKYGYMDRMGAVGVKVVSHYETLKKMLGINPETIDFLKAEYRPDGYKCEGPDEQNESGDLDSHLGRLNILDRYYIQEAVEIVNQGFGGWSSPEEWKVDECGNYFLENVRFAKTLVTNAAKDVLIYSPSIPDSLKFFSEIVDDVEVTTDQFTVIYKDGEEVTVTFPKYPESGHCVPMFEPEKFLNDVAEWIEQ